MRTYELLRTKLAQLVVTGRSDVVTYYRGDCVVINPGPGGNYPRDPSLVGLRGTWQGIVDTTEFIEGQPPALTSFCYVALPGRGQVMIEFEFVYPCPSPDDLVAS